ncbi:MAG: ATP-grasp domain-containing protein [Desulfobacteraceae bacterium]|uniref:ATP-grasp domain-containing protein n=1 Tax=Candidatus Desulfaltia bathyphila TaxID=2841697 RepID=A0A8J6N646_9BACT|nr:ATP-grasp domain-containing protein [Candidatus Desulfaltia bathyphila]MBL7196289.1 ATP-grasp domain-containing protein [Desulfobacterales bacterium]
MILSFHPCFVADKNIICAGRKPGADDLAAIKAAHAVILPQGCYKSLYYMARGNCAYVFPNYDARFKYPGKIGQIKLFQRKRVSLPETVIFRNADSFIPNFASFSKCHSEDFQITLAKFGFDFPFVFKFDWGGEGENVYLIKSVEDLQEVLQKAAIYESTGQAGFLIQEYIPSQNRSLRVVVINRKIITYWRVLKNREGFCSNLSQGAVIDFDSDPDLQEMAAFSVENFCKQAGINLAGIDILFSSELQIKEPLFLEINYFFGRRGLGGSEKYYELLVSEIRGWINSL